MKSKVLAISAISASLTAICLAIGTYIEIAEFLALVLSSIMVILPLYYRSYKGAFLCYIVGGLIGLTLSAFNLLSFVYPAYFLFFGIYPIVSNIFIEKQLNKYICLVIGLIWCLLCVYGIFFYCLFVLNMTMSEFPLWIVENVYFLLVPLGVVFFFIYDRYIKVSKILLDRYLGKIIK